MRPRPGNGGKAANERFVCACSAAVVQSRPSSLHEIVILSGRRCECMCAPAKTPGESTPTGGLRENPDATTHSFFSLLFLKTNVPEKRCAQPPRNVQKR